MLIFCFSSFFFAFFVFCRFSLILLEDNGKRLQCTAEMENFTPTPSAPTPCITSRVQSPCIRHWKRLKGKNPEGKNFRKLLRRKQSSVKISKISRNTIKSSKSDIFYLLRNLLKHLLRTFFSSAKFSEVFTLCIFTLWFFPTTWAALGAEKGTASYVSVSLPFPLRFLQGKGCEEA